MAAALMIFNLKASSLISVESAMLRQSNKPNTERTFVVLGCPRGGTSLLAGSLYLAGVYMGEFKTSQYEDPEFKIPPKDSGEALKQLEGVISERNSRKKYWGWKLPNNIYYIEQIQHLLINPSYLFIYRNPEAVAKSSAKHDGKDWPANREILLEVANNHSDKVRRFQQSLNESASQYTFQLEEVHADPVAYVDKFQQIVYPINVDLDVLLQFVAPSGGYHKLACQIK